MSATAEYIAMCIIISYYLQRPLKIYDYLLFALACKNILQFTIYSCFLTHSAIAYLSVVV